ncbi:MAG: heme o synthase [Gemmatales bacterium]
MDTMHTIAQTNRVSHEAVEQLTATSQSVWHDAMLLGKPRITLMVMMTVAIGFLLAPLGTSQWMLMLHAMCGVGLVAAASGILNQAWERDTDALMRRTKARPMPRGRLSPVLGYTIGFVFGIVGVTWLILAVNTLTAFLAFLTLVLYVCIYTPLKRYTAWNTFVGAIPGAMPPLLGYAAAANALPVESWILAGLLFLWQFPHFFAIAWMYREDYRQGGLVMVSTIDATGGKFTGDMTLATALVLVAFSIVPFAYGYTGYWYLAGALLFGGIFCWAAWRFLRVPCRQTARQTLWASLLYLPLMFLLVLVNGPKVW